MNPRSSIAAITNCSGSIPWAADNGLRAIARRAWCQRAGEVRQGVINLRLDGGDRMTGGPFAQVTGLDNIPLDNFGGTADLGADATDNSADVNVNGANDVAANAAAEAQEIAAFPTPVSAGQAAIIAIIEKYHGKSVGTVEGAAASRQAPRPMEWQQRRQ